jgi:hypothetical protein
MRTITRLIFTGMRPVTRWIFIAAIVGIVIGVTTNYKFYAEVIGLDKPAPVIARLIQCSPAQITVELINPTKSSVSADVWVAIKGHNIATISASASVKSKGFGAEDNTGAFEPCRISQVRGYMNSRNGSETSIPAKAR